MDAQPLKYRVAFFQVQMWSLERRKCMESLLCFLASVARYRRAMDLANRATTTHEHTRAGTRNATKCPQTIWPRFLPRGWLCSPPVICRSVLSSYLGNPNRVAPSLLRQQNASPLDDLTSIKDRVPPPFPFPLPNPLISPNVQVMRVKCLLRNYKSIFQSESDVDTKVCSGTVSSLVWARVAPPSAIVTAA